MTKRKSTKRALLLSALSLLMCVSMLIGTTFAWFTDSVTSKNNIIKSGNLDVELDYIKIVDGVATDWETVKDQDNIFNKDALWEPGHVEVVYLRVSNNGSLQLKYQLGVNFKDITIGKTEDGKDIRLSEHLVFKTVEIAEDEVGKYANRELAKAEAGTEIGLKDYNGQTAVLDAKGGANDKDFVALIVYMPETVGNDANYRGTDIPTIELGINLYATQYTYEKDSFDEFYDKDAWVKGMKVYTANDLQAALNAGETNITVMDDINLTEAVTIPAAPATFARRSAPAPITINLNGKTLTGVGVDANGQKVHTIINKGNAVIVNGTIISSGENGGSAIYTAEGSALVLEDVNIIGSSQSGSGWPSYAINSYGELTINSANITSTHGAIALYGDTVINDANVTMNGFGGSSHVFYIGGEGTDVVVNGGTYTHKGNKDGSLAYIMTGTTMTVNGGTFSASNGGYGMATYTGALIINGGTFANAPENWGGPITINGGTFAHKPSNDFIGEGYECNANPDGTFSVRQGPVVKIGNTSYYSEQIDEAVAAWTDGSTLTLLGDVQLNDVIKLKSTEHHTLELGKYTLTAASGKHAIEITCDGRTSASYALTVNADANEPGGITATGKACIYYKKSDSTKDRPIIRIYNGVFNGSYSINSTSNGNTNCPQIWIYGGTFNGNVNLTKNMLRVFDGTFNGWINCTGDSSAYREISGGRFKSWQFMTADANNKFWVGTGKANYDVGAYVDDAGYLVVGGPVITEAGNKFVASSANYSGWSSYLKYSSAATNGLYYTSAKEAFADNNKTTGMVNIYTSELDMTGISYKGKIVIADTLTVTFAEGTTPAWTVVSSDNGNTVYTDSVASGIVTRTYTLN